MRRLLLLAGSLMALGFMGHSTRAAGDDYACTVYLCTAPDGPGWQTVPACVAPVTTALNQASIGIPWPVCPEAAAASSSSSNGN
jgi:hypothetical protein